MLPIFRNILADILILIICISIFVYTFNYLRKGISTGVIRYYFGKTERVREPVRFWLHVIFLLFMLVFWIGFPIIYLVILTKRLFI